MGSGKSKNKGRGKGQGSSGQYGRTEGVQSPNRSNEYEDIELLLLRRAIKHNPECFVLNNLMMCVQFFENYEKNIELVRKTLVSPQEEELNKRLPPQKRVLLPDVLQEQVSRNVGFTSTRQTVRPTIEPLHPVRIYTVHDNIDITEQNSSSYYSSVNDASMYNILLKPTQHQGYVQLQLNEETAALRKLKKDEVDLSSIAENDDELDSDGDSVYGPKPLSNIVLGRRSKQRNGLASSKYGPARSLPDLPHEERFSAGRDSSSSLYETRSTRNIRAESDYEIASSTEERGYRNDEVRSREEISSVGEYRRHERQPPRTKNIHRTAVNSCASSTTSGYRSGNYAMDSDSSCNVSQNSVIDGAEEEYVSSKPEANRRSYSRKSSKDEEPDNYSINSVEFPHRCFKKITFTADGKIYDPKEERKQLINSKQRRIKLAMRRHNYDLYYISSTEFMRHFIGVFATRLAHPLGFDQEAVEDMKREGCVIYCDKVTVSSAHQYSRVEQYEIMPAFWLPWPNCAQEWLDRPRSTWPDYEDVEKIKDLGCYVVPEGFVPKKGSNLIQDLEWQLVFPTAERYLETCMTQAQVQVYFIALMLHKTFMRPVFDTMFGLTTVHIRNKLFWMIEENDRPSKWPDNRTGECLLNLLNSLYHCISQNEPMLRDYFVRDRNLFHRVPCEHLLHTQKQLKRILENPVMYIFHAIENIRHSEEFFPRMDYEMLLKILTVDTLALVNPALVQQILRPLPLPKEERYPQEDKYTRAGFWDSVKNQRERKIYANQFVTNKTLINPRKATDSIIEISIRCAELEGPRLCALLDFFVRHFIKIADRCHQYQAYRQKAIYLDQADRLAILLSEFSRYTEDSRAYRDKINILRKRSLHVSKVQDEAPTGPLPETPKRTVEAPIYMASLKDRFAPESPDRDSPSETAAKQSQKSSEIGNRGQNNHTTKAIVHEKKSRKFSKEKQPRVEKSANENPSSSNTKPIVSNGTHDPRETEEEHPSVVSLTENPNDSFLSETTYI